MIYIVIIVLSVLLDTGDEAEADLSAASNVVAPSASNMAATKIKSKIQMLISKKVNVDRQFIELYISIISKHQEKPLKLVKTNMFDGENIIDSLRRNLSTDEHMPSEIKHNMLALVEQLQTNSDKTRQSFNNLLCNTMFGKVGVTTENNTTWQYRMNTCNVSPSHQKYECINIPFSIENAKIIEALSFAVLQHFGLKVSNAKTKSSQGEFFKLFIEIEESAMCVQKDIERST